MGTGENASQGAVSYVSGCAFAEGASGFKRAKEMTGKE